MSAFTCTGLYVWDDDVSQHPFWRACGIDTLQFCDLSWHRRAPDVRDGYLRQKAEDIRTAHADGFRVYVILFANIQQWEGPGELCDSPIGYKYHPGDALQMKKRLDGIRHVVRLLREADGFSFFAGDPGGVPAELGPAVAKDWTDMAGQVAAVVREEAPQAAFHINPWAVTMWQYPLLPCEDVAWWQREGELTQQILAQKDLIGPSCGVELPCHNYYRAMALRLFSQAGTCPPLIPDAFVMKDLRARRAQQIWGWPYFLLDEADDGDVGPDGSINILPQAETRYICRFVRQMQVLGLDGLIGNWSYVGHKAKALNTYAFGRFCRDEQVDPETVIDEFAACVAADEKGGRILGQILRLVENNSNWQRKLPVEKRLPAFACRYAGGKEALLDLVSVRPRAEAFPFALAEEPQLYLARIRERLQQLC
ncbi:MAG: hypothetical protein IKI50_07845 [Clostridia bacterium]|nr:hypothetical protein [Clostridia bacterium]